MSLRLVIFDWDGTLMDSARRIVRCMQAAARDVGFAPPEPGVITQQIGLALEVIFSGFFPDATEAQLDALREAYRDHWIERDTTPMPLFPGVEDGLVTLRNAGLSLAVATGKSRPGLERAFEATGLREQFAASRCVDESIPKPDPQMVLDVLKILDVAPEEAVVVGDTSFDMAMATGAGVRALGVGYGCHAADALEDAGAYAICPDFEAVVAAVLAL